MIVRKVPRDILTGWKLVIVDDDALGLTVATTLLAYYGAAIHKAMDGNEGLKVIREVQPRLVISDLSMPNMDGWTMLAHLRRDPAIAQLPVIALTAHAMIGDRQKALDAGFDNYLTKPIIPANFVKDLLRLLVKIPALNLTLPDL
jgi:CheY-like chemotaxis protein